MSEAAVIDPPAAPPAPPPSPPAAPPAPPKAEAPPEKPAGDDWRQTAAKEDAKRAKFLERFTDPTALTDAFMETHSALRDSGRIKVPGVDAKPEELAAFHKAIGVPEKVDGYQITVKPPEGLELGDLDKKVLSDVVTKLHATGATNATVNAAHEFYYAAMEEAEASKHATAELKKSETEAQLKGMWGRDYDLNVQLADAFVAEKFGKRASEIMQMQLMDGTRIGDHAEFMQAFATAGRERAEDPTFIASLNQSGAPQNLEARKTEIMALRYGDDAQKKQYAVLAADGGELDKINARLALKK